MEGWTGLGSTGFSDGIKVGGLVGFDVGLDDSITGDSSVGSKDREIVSTVGMNVDDLIDWDEGLFDG